MSLHVHTSTKLSIGLLFSYLFTFLLTGQFAMREIEKIIRSNFFVEALPPLKKIVGACAPSAPVPPSMQVANTHIHLTDNFPSIANGSE